MKKFSILLLAMMMVFTLAACDSGGGEAPSGDNDTPSQNEQGSVDEDKVLLSSKIGPVLANNFPPQLLKNLFSVSEAPALIIKVQYLALMRQPVQQSCCEDSVAKKLRPAIKAFI